MNGHGHKPLWAGLLMALCLTSAALAVPTLQLWIPGATYDTGMESWFTTANPFELQVLGAQTPATVEKLTDVTLLIAIPDQYWNRKGEDAWESALSLTIEPINGTTGDPLMLGFDDLEEHGIPIMGLRYMPPHGVYPAHYWAVPLPDLLVSTAGMTVHNYNPGEDGTSTGDIHYFNISYTPFDADTLLVMDVFGYQHSNPAPSKWVFAPFSHNAVAHLPEPGVASLLAVGLGGLALRRRRAKAAKRG